MTPPHLPTDPDRDPSERNHAVWSAAERRLQRNRDRLRRHFAASADTPPGIWSTVGDLAQLAAPAARELVRQHPAATLSGAALAGAWLIRLKPWRALGSSMLAGLLARQVVSLSLSSGSQWLNLLTSAAMRGQKPPRPPSGE